ncbi:MAG: phosphate ABC transporter permease subunit PstC [Bacteroidota bacterium]|nr:phosphate ABC transporter permease subunit PstC [Bacteroidota bacterium]
MRKYIEKFTEGILMVSSSITTIIVLLIIIFLFREGIGLFNDTGISDDYKVAVNKNNSISTLSAKQIKDVFNQDITNWKQLGGKDESIILFGINEIGTYYSEEQLGANFEHMPEKVNEFVSKHPGVLAVFSQKFIPKNFQGKELHIHKISLTKMLFGKEWYPSSRPAALFGILPLILGTLWVSIGAILIALPLGMATAIYMAEIANNKVRNTLKPIIELLSGIPSVVYGFFGLIVIVPLIQTTFNLPVGESALAGSIVLGIMALPTIITIAEDAIRTTPRSLKEASLALGANKWQTIVRVCIPYGASGITAGIILGVGRAMGETMAVLMVTGNAGVIPHSFLQPVRTIPATIAAELGETAVGSSHYKALFVLGAILFIITLIINLMVEFVKGKKRILSNNS